MKKKYNKSKKNNYVYHEPVIEYFNNGDFNLVVKESTIPNAGLGLFTKDDIPKDSIIGYYTGDIKHNEQVPSHPGYMFEINESYYIDGGTNPRSLMSMLNDARFSIYSNNCEFGLNFNPLTIAPNGFHEQLVKVVAIRHIYSNEELFISYGADYWK